MCVFSSLQLGGDSCGSGGLGILVRVLWGNSCDAELLWVMYGQFDCKACLFSRLMLMFVLWLMVVV